MYVRIRALKKKRRARLSFDIMFVMVVTKLNGMSYIYKQYINYQHMIFMYTRNSPPYHPTSSPHSTFYRYIQPFVSASIIRAATTESNTFFYVQQSNQSLFGMPLSLFCNIQVPKIRNLFLESNIHFHH